MKYKKRLLQAGAVSLSLAMLLSTLPIGAAYAAETIPKEETIYANLNADGSVAGIYVVNSFDLPTAGRVTDYGNYLALRNMTTTDPIEYRDGLVQAEVSAGKFYYEGTLDSQVLPWAFQFHYWLNGRECQADELAGQTGRLELNLTVQEDPDCRGAFFDEYALQRSLSMDTNQAKNIVAEGATVSNVGSDKQLTWTILPGKGADITVTADVTEFELSEIAINLSMDIDVNDEEIMAQIFNLKSGAIDLDDGVAALMDGVGTLRRGVNEDLRRGIDEL